MDSGSVLLAGFCLNLKGQTVFSLKRLQDSGSLLCVGQFYPLGGCAILHYGLGLSGASRLSHSVWKPYKPCPHCFGTLPAGVTSGPVDGMDDCVPRS